MRTGIMLTDRVCVAYDAQELEQVGGIPELDRMLEAERLRIEAAKARLVEEEKAAAVSIEL
eukprot:1542254-Pyramimonas_sp.AAC.1